MSNPTARTGALEALDEHGFFIVPDVLDRQACAKVRSHLMAAAHESERRGAATYVQSIVIPEPWLEPWAINIIWCLDDVYADNGATRCLPRSHRITHRAELPADMNARMRCFEAPAGAIIAMDGRMWHTSGSNVTKDQERALLFGFYTRDFIRPQVNWNALLSEETKAQVDPPLYDGLGLGPAANVYYGSNYTVLPGEHA